MPPLNSLKAPSVVWPLIFNAAIGFSKLLLLCWPLKIGRALLLILHPFWAWTDTQSPSSQTTKRRERLGLWCTFVCMPVCCSGVRGCVLRVRQKGNMHLLFVDRYNNLTLSNQGIFLCTGAHCETKQTQQRRGEGRGEGRRGWGRAEANNLIHFFFFSFSPPLRKNEKEESFPWRQM